MNETKIAEENLKEWDKGLENTDEMETHKASCQRFLEFLEEERNFVLNLNVRKGFDADIQRLDILNDKKITDLKNAIKKYVEAGI